MTKRPTARAVAELAGVSRTTVSFVLNDVPGMRISEETRQRVLQAARELNYYPDATARRMVAGRTKIIGFVLRQHPEQAFADMFLPQVLSGLSRVANAEGYHVLFEPIAPDHQAHPYLRLIRERHVDGIILSGPRFDDQELLQTETQGIPIVLMGQLPGAKLPFIDIDNKGGARRATEHLIELGHRRIAMITNAEVVYTASASRLAGYQAALEAAGIAYAPALVRYGNFTPHSGQTAMAELIAQTPQPTAVFVASDTVALGVAQAIRQAGLGIPDDIALIGFDDIPLAEFVDPPLTTVRLPATGLGWGAAELLIRLIAAEEAIHDSTVILDTELVVRKSCGAQQ